MRKLSRFTSTTRVQFRENLARALFYGLETLILLNPASFSMPGRSINSYTKRTTNGVRMLRARWFANKIWIYDLAHHAPSYLVFRTTTTQNDVSRHCTVALSATRKRDNCFQMTTADSQTMVLNIDGYVASLFLSLFYLCIWVRVHIRVSMKIAWTYCLSAKDTK